MPAKKASNEPTVLEILAISQGRMKVKVIGQQPLYFNSVSEKARRELLLPRQGRMTQADKASNLKHDPVAEFRASVYRSKDSNGPTRLVMPAPAFKGAMMTAALDLPGTKRTEIGRLCWVTGTHIPIWGLPKLKMDIVRSADINRTPDVRTRALLERWCTEFEVAFVEPKLNALGVTRLLMAGGITAGVGDFRQEKGKGNYGQFQIVGDADKDNLKLWAEIVRSGGRKEQDRALEAAEPYDPETEATLEWYNEEILRRGRNKPATDAKPTRRRRHNGADESEGTLA